MNTKAIGLISEAAVALALLKRGYTVLQPLGENARYDLVFEDGDGFHRVQCRTGRPRGGAVIFRTRGTRVNTRTRLRATYEGVEFFGVYRGEVDKVYLVPTAEPGSRESRLRAMPARNGQPKGIRAAVDYELEG